MVRLISTVCEKGSLICIVLCFLLFTSISCHPPSNEDKARLKELQVKYGEKYSFKLDSNGLYIYARLKAEANIQQSEDEDIYKMFIFVDFVKEIKRDTRYHLLNFYDEKGTFMYQLAYNFRTHTFVRGHTEYH